MDLPRLDSDHIIPQFEPKDSNQWQLNDANIKRIDPETRETILHNYCKHINSTPLEVFKWLIETKLADINLQDHKRCTPFHYALVYFQPDNGGDIAILTYFLSLPNITITTLLFHTACQNINRLTVDIFKCFIETHRVDLNAKDSSNNSSLVHAIGQFAQRDGGDVTILTYLLNQNGINRNAIYEADRTLLHIACDNINEIPLVVFQLLIERHGGDSDLNTLDKFNCTPFHFAFESFDKDKTDVAILTYLLHQKSINFNIRDNNGYTLLHVACLNINYLPIGVFQTLMEINSSHINVKDNYGDTPIHIVINNFRSDSANDVFKYLLSQKSIDINARDQDGRTLFHFMCLQINSLSLDLFKCLIETQHVDFNSQDNYGDTPLHHALQIFKLRNDINILTFLLSHEGINLNIKGQLGFTLLHQVCIRRDWDDPNHRQLDNLWCKIAQIINQKYIQSLFEGVTH
jgi:ankyrin repeat protein